MFKLDNAGIATDVGSLEIVNHGGLQRVSDAVNELVTGAKGTTLMTGMLTTG